MHDDQPQLLVIIPTHDRWAAARRALASLQRSEFQNFEVALIEDGCRDDTAAHCRREFPAVKILHGDGNLWWSGAINEGLRYALGRGQNDGGGREPRAVLWLNDDNLVEPQTIGQLWDSWRRCGERSVICARVKSTRDGRDEWAGDPPLWHPDFPEWNSPLAPEGNSEGGPQDVSIKHPPGGRGVLIPLACFRETGLIDRKSFPHYWADHDFHYRAMRAGYRYVLSARAVVWNEPNRATMSDRERASLHGICRTLFGRRSNINVIELRRLLKRHLPAAQYRAAFYPLLRRHLIWLTAGWTARRPLVHESLKSVWRNLDSAAAAITARRSN